MIHLAVIDILIIVTYFAAIVFIGFRTARKTQTTEMDFLLAGRSLTLPIFVMTLVSTWYGGVLGVGEYSYRFGISNWVTQGLPYYIFAAIFAFFLAKKVRATNLFSIPDKLAASYDRKTALLGSFLTFILMTPAPYILMFSVLLQLIFGWNMFTCLIVTAITAISYINFGGFRSDVATNILEFFLMFLGFVIIIPFCIQSFGGMNFLTTHLPPAHLTWNGGNSFQYILIWFFIALWTLVDPSFHQRCYAAKNGTVAQNGILLSIIFWFVFDFITTMAGLYARAALPNLDQPMMSYPLLAEAVLPPVAKGIFYVGMLAPIMSTLNSLAFVSGQTLGRDFYLQLRTKSGMIAHHSSTFVTQIGVIVSFIISIILALLIPSVINLWYTIGTVIIPGLLVPLMASYFDRLKISARFAFSAMLFGWLTSLGWLLTGLTNGHLGDYLLGIEPMYPGLVVSIIFWIAGKIEIRSVKLKQVHL